MIPYPKKDTPLDAPIIDPIRDRWSPLAFDPTPLKEEEIRSLFEAARWAASSYGEQPWRYIYAGKNDEGRDAMESLLVDGNSWAKNAGLLITGFAKKTFTNGKPNGCHVHDTGAASALLTIQATAMGLITHQMAGFDYGRANEALGVPADFEATSMIAVGHPGDPALLSPDLQARQDNPRSRMPQEKFAMRGTFQA